MSDELNRPLSADELEHAKQHPLASRVGLALVLTELFRMGAMCPKCGHGTRVTSKRWARCRKCGERVARQTPGDQT